MLTLILPVSTEENGLDGPLPEEISTLYTVEDLTFYDNALSSSIPEGIGNLTVLKLLDLESNSLTGSFFTDSILSLPEIVALRASFNELNGTIPTGIDALSDLKQLWVAGNQFNGPLPTQFGSLSSLGTIICGFSYTVFCVALVADFLVHYFLFVRTESLFLYNNSFDGNIISEFGSLTNLTDLRLYGNVFDGSIPEEIYDATNLLIFRVDLNFLQGELSTNIGKLTNLEDLRVNTQFPPGFSGNIPAELGACSLLRKLMWPLSTNGLEESFE